MSPSFWTATVDGRPLTVCGDRKATAPASKQFVGWFAPRPAWASAPSRFTRFSSDNWGRPLSEVSALLNLLEEYFRAEAGRCAAENVRLRVIGRRDRLPPSLADAIETAERLTAHCRGLQLRIAVDYSSRDAILRAACWMLSSAEVSQREFAKRLGEVTHATGPALDVDLLIRTGGDRRLSDFMLWECAYAELFFTPRRWPDFGGGRSGRGRPGFPRAANGVSACCPRLRQVSSSGAAG